jgi:hypothetical protein
MVNHHTIGSRIAVISQRVDYAMVPQQVKLQGGAVSLAM